MASRKIAARTRFFVAVEGESERSFVVWLQNLSEEALSIHLDTVLLNGGGFKSMLEKAVRHLKKRSKASGAYKGQFLIVDRDRSEQGDWSIEKLRRDAQKHKMAVLVQKPNHEGLLLRMMPGMERENPSAAIAATRLKTQWSSYQKPVNAQTLTRRFSLEDLLRASRLDEDLTFFLKSIGLITEE